jgi:hypothetical protein
VIHDSSEADETPPDTEMRPIAGPPGDALLFLVLSRYCDCDSDKLADFAVAIRRRDPTATGAVGDL